ncbi:ABC transporter substrate-binding protein [Amycolatopsis thermoflava]
MRSSVRSMFLFSAALLVASCAAPAPPDSHEPARQIDYGIAAPATPPDPSVVEAARREGGLVLYTNANDTQTTPLVQGFQRAYPGITVRTLSLGPTETFQRYLSESATGARTADVILNSDAGGWMDFVRRGAVADYDDPNLAHLPAYARLLPGVAAMSEDPLIAVFNKALLPVDQQPRTLAAMAELAPKIPAKIGTYTIGSSPGYGGTYAYVSRNGDAGWGVLEKLGQFAKAEDSAGTLITKLTQGQYQASYFLSGASRATVSHEYSQILNYRYLSDATPLLPRGIAVTSKAASPNAARVFVNWALSVEGQQAACEGGFTPYRDGVVCPTGLRAIAAEIGQENIVPGTYAPAMVTDQAAVVARWNKAFGR